MKHHVIYSESHRMTRMGWGFCDGCGRKMLKEHMTNNRCVPCETKKHIREREERIKSCLTNGKQLTLIQTT